MDEPNRNPSYFPTGLKTNKQTKNNPTEKSILAKSYLKVSNPPLLSVGDGHHADGADHEQVKGRWTHDGAGTQILGLEVVADDLDDWQQDLRGRGAEGHEGEVGHGVAPDPHLDHLRLVLLLRGQVYLEESQKRGVGSADLVDVWFTPSSVFV